MERLRESGEFVPPTLAMLEAAQRAALALGRGRVFADTWALEPFSACPHCFAARRERLETVNLTSATRPRSAARSAADHDPNASDQVDHGLHRPTEHLTLYWRPSRTVSRTNSQYLRAVIGPGDVRLLGNPPPGQIQFTGGQFEMAHRNTHVDALEVGQPQQGEQQASFAVARSGRGRNGRCCRSGRSAKAVCWRPTAPTATPRAPRHMRRRKPSATAGRTVVEEELPGGNRSVPFAWSRIQSRACEPSAMSANRGHRGHDFIAVHADLLGKPAL